MMRGRPLANVVGALRAPQHYRALANMARVYPRPVDALARYVFGRGTYPTRVSVRTPTGVVRPWIYTGDDMLTLNEVFCRVDYAPPRDARVVVDVGSNIGLSVLYFLTRRSQPFCYLYEPDPRNVARLQGNLADYAERWTLTEAAVAATAGRVCFGTEPTGRYGGVGVTGTETIVVDCVAINDVLERALAKHGTVDFLKIDTEGLELETVRAIEPTLLRRVRQIALEASPAEPLHPALFSQSQYGSIRRLTRRTD